MVNVLFRANSGYEIDRNTVSASINGQNAAWWSTISDGWSSQYYYIEYTVPESNVPGANTSIPSVKISGVTEPVIGETPDFSIDLTGEGAVIDEYDPPYWYKYNPSNPANNKWEPVGMDVTFSEGDYLLEVWLAVEDGYEFTEDTECFFDEEKLPDKNHAAEGESCYLLDSDEYVVIYLYFTLEEGLAEPTSIPSVKISDITEPAIGATPDFTITLSGEGAAFDEEEGNGWWKIDPETYHWELLDEDTPFGAGLYALEVCLKSESGYEFADTTKFYYNDDELPEYDGSYKSNYELWDGGAGIYLYFTLEGPADPTPITSVKVSDVTEPAIGATPDFDITLTGEGVALYEYDEEEWEAIAWDKLDPETNEWVPMDADTPFEAGTYCLLVALQFESGYELTDTTKFYYNDDELPEYDGSYKSNYEPWDDGVDIFIYFTLEDPAGTTYTVTFDANGGSGTMVDVTGIYGEYILPLNGFAAPEGMKFKGWEVDSTQYAAGDKITVTENTTVTAIWEAVEYNIYVSNGTASVGASTPVTKAVMGTTVTLVADNAPSGKVFDKWVVNGGDIVLADAAKAETTFTMPAEIVEVTATYKDKTVTPPAGDENDNSSDTPQTGDKTNIELWSMMLAVSGLSAAAMAVWSKKKILNQ